MPERPGTTRHEQTLRALLADAHAHGGRCQLTELHHFARGLEALDALLAENERLRKPRIVQAWRILRSRRGN